MATKIRLARFGRKKRPFFRIVVSDSRSPRNGRHIEKIGYYDPLTSPATVYLDKEKTLDWLKKGAVPTQTARNLMSQEGITLEFDMRKRGVSEEVIKEELQKFAFLREEKKKKEKETAASRAKEKAVKAEPEEEPQAEERPAEAGVPAEPAIEDAGSAAPEVSAEADVTAETVESEAETQKDETSASAASEESAESDTAGGEATSEDAADEPEKESE